MRIQKLNDSLDVAIIGGGPAGSTLGTLLKKYDSGLRVGIFEREHFPRDHIGESLLPPTGRVLSEMGCWDKVEAAGFPIKVGATYRWGKCPELWYFDFLRHEEFRDEPRPGTYQGQRLATSFQVDRAIYDQVLIDHAAALGCEVHFGAKVSRVQVEGDQVIGLELQSGEVVTARYYVDASGNSGILRRALNIRCDYPSTLKNIAIYDYWQDAEWAVKIGVGGTRIQVLTVGYGWLWFIPVGETRTSIGLVVPSEYYKGCGLSPAELYSKALRDEPIVAGLLENATCEGNPQATRDWSFLAERQSGENWFLVGECAGFADPILSAGVTMAHLSSQQLACTILELDRGKLDRAWLRSEFEARQSQRIRTHIRFGDYWYTANEQFKDLQDFTTKLAADSDLDLGPEAAWAWIAQGGFIDEDLGIGSGGFSLSSIKAMSGKLGDLDPQSPFRRFNTFKLDLAGATWKDRASYQEGRIRITPCYQRGKRVLPIEGHIEAAVTVLEQHSDISDIVRGFRSALEDLFHDSARVEELFQSGMVAIEAMVSDGWIDCSYDPSRPLWAPSDWSDRPVEWDRSARPGERS